jgi:rhodanese-related sulfurtransferase
MMLPGIFLIAFGLWLYFDTMGRQIPPEYVNVASDEAIALMEQFDVTVLDVREDHEFAQGRIPGSVHIPLGSLKGGRYKELDRNSPVLVVSRSGQRSADASQFLIDMDFPFVYNLLGGIQVWPGEIVSD